MAVEPVVLDNDILALNEAGLAEALTKFRSKASASVSASGIDERTTGIARCCARAAIGHAGTPPTRLMNSRRLIAAPEAWDTGIVAAQMRVVKGCSMSALGQKQAFALHQPMSALPPNSDIDCVLRHVRFGPRTFYPLRSVATGVSI